MYAEITYNYHGHTETCVAKIKYEIAAGLIVPGTSKIIGGKSNIHIKKAFPL